MQGDVLDIKTMTIVFVCIHAFMVLLVFSAWRQNRDRYDGIGYWVLDTAFFTVGQILLVLRGTIPDFLSIVVSNMLTVTSVLFVQTGLTRFVGRKPASTRNYFLLTALFFTYIHFTFRSPSLSLRTVALTVTLFLLLLQSAVLLLRLPRGEMKRASRGPTAVLILFLLLLAVRLFSLVLHPLGENLFQKDNPVNPLFILLLHFLAMALIFSFILMINKRLSLELARYVGEKEKLVDELERLATTDKLTGIYNRAKLDSFIDSEQNRLLRYHHHFSVILIDIDNFKQVNDTLGHLAGDHILQELARLLKRNIRETDILGRWGGEEFLIICPETTANNTCAVARKLRNLVAQHEFTTVGEMTISLGVASTSNYDGKENIIRRADSALYQAKGLGRNRVEQG